MAKPLSYFFEPEDRLWKRRFAAFRLWFASGSGLLAIILIWTMGLVEYSPAPAIMFFIFLLSVCSAFLGLLVLQQNALNRFYAQIIEITVGCGFIGLLLNVFRLGP